MEFREGRNEVTAAYNPKERVGPEEDEAIGRHGGDWSGGGRTQELAQTSTQGHRS